MPTEGFGKDVMGIAFMLGGIALWALVLSRSGDAVNIIKGAGQTYGGLLQIVTLQSGFQNAFN
jgi:hypothetical protein